MRRLVVLCGIAALAGLCACGLLLAGSSVFPVLPTAVLGIKPRPVPVFTLPVPPAPKPPAGFEASAGPILFVSTRDGAAEVYQMNGTGVGQTRLTSAFGGVADPTLSDFGKLTYSAVVDGQWQILAGTGSATPEPVTHDAGSHRQPRWMAESRLLYVSNRSGNEDVWRLDTTTGVPTDLTPASAGPDRDPAPSPDGTKVAYASSPGAGSPFHIYVLTLATGSVAQLTHGEADDRHPSWSPDGSRIAFDRTGSGGGDIWTMAADGTDERSVIATGADEFEPSYAPAPVDGKVRLAYVTNKNGNYEIWAADDDGSNAFDLSQSPGGDDYAPFWAPSPKALYMQLGAAEVEGAGGGPNTVVQCTIVPSGSKVITGTPYKDTICGSKHADVIRGLGGDDVIFPRGGNDLVLAGKGDDTIYARGQGADTIRGGSGTDTAYVDDTDRLDRGDVETTIP